MAKEKAPSFEGAFGLGWVYPLWSRLGLQGVALQHLADPVCSDVGAGVLGSAGLPRASGLLLDVLQVAEGLLVLGLHSPLTSGVLLTNVQLDIVGVDLLALSRSLLAECKVVGFQLGLQVVGSSLGTRATTDGAVSQTEGELGLSGQHGHVLTGQVGGSAGLQNLLHTATSPLAILATSPNLSGVVDGGGADVPHAVTNASGSGSQDTLALSGSALLVDNDVAAVAIAQGVHNLQAVRQAVQTRSHSGVLHHGIPESSLHLFGALLSLAVVSGSGGSSGRGLGAGGRDAVKHIGIHS